MTGVIGVRPQLSEADLAELAGRWREKWDAAGAHRVMTLPAGTEWTRLPVRSCSYCCCEMTGIRCGNCGAPATSQDGS